MSTHRDKIVVDRLAREVMKELQEYGQLAAKDMKKCIRDASKFAQKELQRRSPSKTGSYRYSWKIKTTYETANVLHQRVHSPTHYRLTHLLEKGHAYRKGGEIVASPKPHIAPANEATQKKLEQDIIRALQSH